MRTPWVFNARAVLGRVRVRRAVPAGGMSQGTVAATDLAASVEGCAEGFACIDKPSSVRVN